MFLTNLSKKLILLLSLLNQFLPNQLIPLLLPKREKIKNSISFLQRHLSLMDGISLLSKMLNLIALGKIY
jgi:UV DNA damage repair endonuclease